MITTVLIEHPWLTTAALTALVLGAPFAVPWLATHRRVTQLLLAVSVAVVLLLTLSPTSASPADRCAIEWSAPRLGRVELMANLVLFAPPVGLVAILTRRPLLALAVGSAASVLIETVQLGLPALGRSCSTNDWLYNSLGAALGVAIAVAGRAVSARWDGSAARRPRDRDG
ncbi:VanZ family protein [Aeromicrobium alkaliterrae]|uniref:VanZ-like domain-containing protein n=1 Tax=Aeromicrobium alkaliterrae TaxID=302168 RepID=A0ABP4W9E9_9ACTN